MQFVIQMLARWTRSSPGPPPNQLPGWYTTYQHSGILLCELLGLDIRELHENLFHALRNKYMNGMRKTVHNPQEADWDKWISAFFEKIRTENNYRENGVRVNMVLESVD
jgi:hypothetical protein